jgi:hypothetical protein
MTRFLRLTFVLAVIFPAALHAQRGRGGGRRQAPPALKAKDLEYLSPATIALDRKRDLDLTAAQAVQLDSATKAYGRDAKDFGRAIDTLQGVMQEAMADLRNNPVANGTNVRRPRPESAKDSIKEARKDSVDQIKADADQQRFTSAKNALTSTLLKIRAWYDTQIAVVNGLLTDVQRGKIGPTFESAAAELTERLHWTNGGG